MTGKHIALTLMVAAAITIATWQYRPVVWTAMPIFGLCLGITGFILWSIARFQLGSSFAVTAQARHLVTQGLYSKLRNPNYVFGSLVIAGGILFAQRPAFLWIFLVLIPLQVWRAGKESKVLEEKFGDEYRKYRAQTWF
jgi:protein-S-isoprenylcysteine O-methyltransferase Ste14